MAALAAASVRHRIHYGWIVVAITFASSMAAAGVRAAPGVFIIPFQTEFGWSRTVISEAISINLLLFGLAAPFAGLLIDQIGPKRVMMGSLAALALGVSGTMTMRSLWQLDLFWGVIVGIGGGFGATVVAASVATRWFVERRGLALGILGGASSTGQIIFFPVLMALTVNFGWRYGSVLMAAAMGLMLIPVFLWMRDSPAEVGLRPYGDSGEATQASGEEGPPTSILQAIRPLLQAVRAPEFWLLAGSFFTCGATSAGLVGTHFIPHSIDHGIPEETAALTLGIMGAVNIAGTLTAGWLTDRIDPRKVLAFAYTLRGLSLFVLPFVVSFSGLLIFAVVYGFDWFATVPPTVALATRRFGKRSVAGIYGWIFASHQLGSALAATAGGAIRTGLGDYEMAFLAGGVLALLGAGMAMCIPSGRAIRPEPEVTVAAAPAA